MNKYKIKIPLLLSFLLLSFIVGTASAEQVVVTSGRVVKVYQVKWGRFF